MSHRFSYGILISRPVPVICDGDKRLGFLVFYTPRSLTTTLEAISGGIQAFLADLNVLQIKQTER